LGDGVGDKEEHRGARSGEQRRRRREGNTGSRRGEAEEARVAADLHRRRWQDEGGKETAVSVFNRLPTEGYTQDGKFWVRRRRDLELKGARNTKLR
jgi:hypothetical protein